MHNNKKQTKYQWVLSIEGVQGIGIYFLVVGNLSFTFMFTEKTVNLYSFYRWMLSRKRVFSIDKD